MNQQHYYDSGLIKLLIVNNTCKKARLILFDLFGINSRHIWHIPTSIKLQSILACLFICLASPSLTLVFCVCAQNKQHFKRIPLNQLKTLVLPTHSSRDKTANISTAALSIPSHRKERAEFSRAVIFSKL